MSILVVGIIAIIVLVASTLYAQQQQSGSSAPTSGGVGGTLASIGSDISQSLSTLSSDVSGALSGVVIGGIVGATYSQKVLLLAEAIAQAEGFYIPGSVPNRFNNPGDLSPADCGSYASTFASGSNIAELPDAQTGWNCLYNKLANIEAGNSRTYPLSFTFAQMAQTYAGNWQPWLNIVTAKVGVSPDDTLADYFAGNVGF